MKILLSVMVAAVAFGALVIAGPQRPSGGADDRMAQGRPSDGPKKHVKMLMMLSCLCDGDFTGCTMADTFFDCVKQDMQFLGNITNMSPCDIEMKLQNRTGSCFSENGSMMAPIMECKKKMHEKKMEMMEKMGNDKSEMFKPCMAAGGSREES